MAKVKLDTLELQIVDNAEVAARHLEKLKNQMKTLVPNTTVTKLDKFNKTLRGLGTGSGYNSLVSSLRTIKSLISATLLGITGSKFFQNSSDYIESLNLFHVTMREGTKAAYDYAEAVQSAMGIDIKDWMDYQGKFQNLASGYGIVSEKASVMSKNLTQLTYDLSSVFNVDPVKAYEKLQSAMSGQVKALKSWGVDVSVASMKQYALNKGIKESWTSLSVGTQAMLRYNYILEKTTALQGDLGRTLQTPANAVRILKAQFTQFERAIGNILSLLITKAIPYFQAFIELLKEAANDLATLWGYDPNSFVDWSQLDSTALTESLEESEEAATKLKRTLLGFDEINALNGASGSGTGGSGYDLDIALNEYDFLTSMDRTVIDKIKDKLKGFVGFLSDIAKDIKNLWSATLDPLWDIFVTDGFEAFAVISGIAGVLGSMKYGKIAGGIGAIASAFLLAWGAGKKLADKCEDFEQTIMIDLLGGVAAGAIGGYIVGGPIGALIGGLGALALAFISNQVESYKLQKQLLDTQVYENNGKKIQDLKEDVEEYLGSIGLGKDEQQKWIDKIEATTTAFENAQEKYNDLWTELNTKKEWDTEDINDLRDAFNELADSIKAVNDANIESVMSNISRAVENNISPSLTSKLKNLNDAIAEFKVYADLKMNDLQKRYNDILKDIELNGDKDGSKKQELMNIAQEVQSSTKSGRSQGWDTTRDAYEEQLIMAGSNYNEVKANLDSFIQDEKDYLKTLLARQQEDLSSTLWMQSERPDLITDDYIEALKKLFKAERRTVYDEFNGVLERYKEQIADREMQIAWAAVTKTNAYQMGEHLPGFWEMQRDGKINVLTFGAFDSDFMAAVSTYNELVDLIKLIDSAKISEYEPNHTFGRSFAVGGFPEDGLFFANSTELVGKFTNGRTAVANNEQIIEGIKRGVAEANRESGGGGDWTIQIIDPNGQVTGETIITAAERRNRRDGKTVISIGAY